MSNKIFSGVAGASFIIIIFSLISKGLGFIREIVFANSFGLTKDFDIYLVGSVVPSIINTGIIYLGQNFFIPSYNKIKSEGDSGVRYFNNIFWLFVLSGFIIGIIFYFSAGIIVNVYLPNTSSQTKIIAEKIFQIISLTIPLNAGIAIISAYFQAEFKFKTPAVSQLLVNLSIILLTVLFSKEFNVFVIPAAFLIGICLQILYLFIKVRGILKINYFTKINIKEIFSFFSPTLFAIIIIEILSQMYALSDRFFLKQVDSGGIAAINYAQNLFLLPVSIFSIALSTAIFPRFADKFHNKKEEELKRYISEGLKMNSFISVPVTILFVFFGDLFVTAFYKGGKFTAADCITTFNVLRIFSISLLFYSAYAIFNKVLYGINEIKSLLLLTAGGIFVKIILNFILVKFYKQSGLALSTSITYILFFFGSLLFIFITTKFNFIYSFFKDTTLSLLNGIISLLIIKLLFSGFLFGINLTAVLAILSFLIVYSINSLLLKQNSVALIFASIKMLFIQTG